MEISDRQVMAAVVKARRNKVQLIDPAELLENATGEPQAACVACLERAVDKGLLNYGQDRKSCWLTLDGMRLLRTGASLGKQGDNDHAAM